MAEPRQVAGQGDVQAVRSHVMYGAGAEQHDGTGAIRRLGAARGCAHYAKELRHSAELHQGFLHRNPRLSSRGGMHNRRRVEGCSAARHGRKCSGRGRCSGCGAAFLVFQPPQRRREDLLRHDALVRVEHHLGVAAHGDVIYGTAERAQRRHQRQIDRHFRAIENQHAFTRCARQARQIDLLETCLRLRRQEKTRTLDKIRVVAVQHIASRVDYPLQEPELTHVGAAADDRGDRNEAAHVATRKAREGCECCTEPKACQVQPPDAGFLLKSVGGALYARDPGRRALCLEAMSGGISRAVEVKPQHREACAGGPRA